MSEKPALPRDARLVTYDETGMFELDVSVTEAISGGLPKPWAIVKNLLNDEHGNRVCLSPNVACGKDVVCG
jgi:hypothetical protein